MNLSREQSRRLQKRAAQFLPGGVDSPVRAFAAVGGDPPMVVRAEGAYLWDADENRYVDLFGSWGPMVLGHSAPKVVKAVQDATARGTSFGASTPTEADLAEKVVQVFPSVEMLRFVSSGTEATMSAIRLARAWTGRNLFIKFEGCYHGHADALLVKAGSGVATLGIPGSAGVPREAVQHTLALPYNDIAAVEETFARHKDEIACILVEPVVGNAGCIAPRRGYLEALRTITEKHGALLIFDEVMTGFRVALGGAQELYCIRPDLTCLGKILGGGLPCGAFGGRKDIMQQLAPLGPVYQAGTLSGNPLVMAAGIATLDILMEQNQEIYPRMERTSAAVADGVAEIARKTDVPVVTNRVGSMFTWFFTGEPVKDYASASHSDTAKFAAFHRAMFKAGIWLPPSQFEAAFLSASHGEQEIELILRAAQQAMAAVAQLDGAPQRFS